MLESPVYWSALAGLVVVFWALPARVRLPFLAVAGLATIAWFDAFSVVILIGLATATDAVLPPLASAETRHRGWLLTLAIVAIVLPLLVFKSGVISTVLLAQTRPHASDIIVPLGMSYYSFRLVHVVMEVFKGRPSRSVHGTISRTFSFHNPAGRSDPTHRSLRGDWRCTIRPGSHPAWRVSNLRRPDQASSCVRIPGSVAA